MVKWIRTLWVSAVLIASTTVAQAAVVYLKDGSKVIGTIVSATARDLQVQTDHGALTIMTDRVSRVDYANDSASVSAPAGPVTSHQFVSFGLGAGVPLSRVDFGSTGGGTDSNGAAGIVLSGQYLYYGGSPKLGLGITTEFFNRSATRSQSLLPISNTDVFGNSVLFLATAKYSLVENSAVRPYILGGIGHHIAYGP